MNALLILAGLLGAFSEPKPAAVDWQEIADKEPWIWRKGAASFYCYLDQLDDYQREIISKKGALGRLFFRCRIMKDGKEVCSFDAHEHTVFECVEDKLYLADYFPFGNGCSIVAYDLKARKQLWKTQLKSNRDAPFDYSLYSNSVTLENYKYGGEVLVVRGDENGRHYIEFVDMRTGKTLAQRFYKRPALLAAEDSFPPEYREAARAVAARLKANGAKPDEFYAYLETKINRDSDFLPQRIVVFRLIHKSALASENRVVALESPSNYRAVLYDMETQKVNGVILWK